MDRIPRFIVYHYCHFGNLLEKS